MNDLSLPPIRPGRPADDGLASRRAQMGGLAAIQIVDSSVRIIERSLGGVPVIEAIPVESKGVLLYAHGGGFRMGTAATWGGFASRVAQAASLTVVVPDYGLAPEVPFPGALHDLAAVLTLLRREAPISPYFLGGDSAGGGLACALTLALLAAGKPGPSGLVLLSPWLDLTVSSDSYARRSEADVVFSREAAVEGAEQYLQGHKADDPLASPLLGDLSGFPSTWIGVGGREVLLDDSLALLRKLADASVAVDLRFEPEMLHVWPIIAPAVPESTAAIASMSLFLQQQVVRASCQGGKI